jgi:hypothetical protein
VRTIVPSRSPVKGKPKPSLQGGGKEQWLLVKKKDDAADERADPVRTEPQSVISGLWVEDLAEPLAPGNEQAKVKRSRSKPAGRYRAMRKG